MVYVYLLELEDGFYYVGSAADTNIRQRLSIYADPNHEKLPIWVRTHKFLKVIAVIKCPHQEDENKWVKIMMKHFTHDKVRGGSYSQTNYHLETVRAYFL
jgi:predicted GIY-YIG superfamily endonuclease